jgi:flavin-dependent dehydrogenase
MALSRCRLDEALLQRASDLGVEVRRGARVFAALFAEGFWRIETEDHQPLVAKNLFVATGKHDLPGRPRPKGKQTGFVGFKMHLRLTPQQTAALGGHIELMVFRGGYAGLTCVEDGIADLGWIAHRDELQRAGGIESLLQDMQRQCPLLAERLAGAHRCFPKPLAISPIPYGYVRRESQDGLWWLGDQAAVIPSFTGDGMSIALHSGRLAARMYLAGSDASGYQQALASQLRCQVAMATAFSRGLIWPPTRSAMLFAARIWPGSMAWLARRTRIAERIRT